MRALMHEDAQPQLAAGQHQHGERYRGDAGPGDDHGKARRDQAPVDQQHPGCLPGGLALQHQQLFAVQQFAYFIHGEHSNAISNAPIESKAAQNLLS